MRSSTPSQRIMRVEPANPDSTSASAREGGRSEADVTDAVLIQRFIYGKDQSAFTCIVERYSRLVLGVALRHLRDRNRAEDVFQATFLVLAENARKIRKRKSLASWLHGVARRIALRTMAEVQRETMWESNMEPASTLFAGVGESFERQTLDEELAQLPEKYRDPITLHYLEGLSHEEIGRRLGLSPEAVDGRLKRGRKDLRLRLARRGVSLSIAMGVFHFAQQAASAATFSTIITSTSVAAQALAAGTAVSTCTPNAVLLAGKEITAMAAAKTTMVLTLTGVCCLAAGLVIAGGNGDETGVGSASGSSAGLTSLVDDGGFGETGGEANIDIVGSAATGGFSGDAAASGTSGGGGVSFTEGEATAEAEPVTALKIYHLQFIAASDMSEVVRTLLPQLVTAVESRSNSLIVQGTEEQQQQLEALLRALDTAEATTGAGGGDAAGGFGQSGAGAGSPMGSGFGGGPNYGVEGMTGGMMMGMPGMGGMSSGMGPNAPASVDYGTQSENRQRIEAAFQQPTQADFQAMPLSQVMDYISELHEIPILLDERALQDAGITPDEEITFTLIGLTLQDAMELMLQDVAGTRLTYIIKNDVVTITTEETAVEFMETRLYEMRNYQGLNPEIAMQLIQEGTSGQWKEVGGEGGAIVPIQGGLMIRQTQRVHREIHALLEQLQRFTSVGLATPDDWQNVDGSGYLPGMMGGDMYGAGGGGMYGAGMGGSGSMAVPGMSSMGGGGGWSGGSGAMSPGGPSGGNNAFGGGGGGGGGGYGAQGGGPGDGTQFDSGGGGAATGSPDAYGSSASDPYGTGVSSGFDAGEDSIPGGSDSVGP